VACDAAGVLTLFNRAAREFHGLPPAPIPSREWAEYYDLYLPDGRTQMREEDVPLARALKGETVANCEMVIAPKGGPARTLLASARPLFGPDGRRLGAVAVMHDITARTRAEEALRRESRLMQALMDNIPDAIYFKDTAGRFTRVNRHAPYRGDVSPEEVIGKTDFDFFIERHARAAYEDEQRIIRTGEPIVDKEEQEVYPDGSTTWLSTTKAPILDEGGRVTGIVGVSRDITERKRAEEARVQLAREQAARAEAETANRLKDEFLAVVSHELRTPLTPIVGWAGLLRAGGYDSATLGQALETIERCAKAQRHIVDDLLDVSRIVTGNLQLALAPVDLGSIVEAAVAAARPAAAARSIGVEAVLPARGEVITGDAGRLQQIVSNLLSNAVKFTPEGGRVEVRLERSGEHVEIVVSDTGVGISPEFLPHVFEKFRQADGSRARAHGGLGLGLAIVRHLVELHGGTVRAESRGKGEGASFTVRLAGRATPGARVDAEGPRPDAEGCEAAPEAGLPLAGVRVLLVDDEPDTLDFFSAALRGYGADVSVAAGAGAALAELTGGRGPHVLVSDIGMPGEDGYDLIRKVRALPPERGGSIPALALTAYAGAEDKARALSSGYQAHLAKPVTPAELLAAVASLAGRVGKV
jgi:PAS domain S-box-containing protein